MERHSNFRALGGKNSEREERRTSTSDIQVLENSNEPQERERSQVSEPLENEYTLVIPEVEDFVAAVYTDDEKWSIGKISEVDEDQEEAEVSFMITQRKDKYKWPLKQDIIWVSFKNILCEI